MAGSIKKEDHCPGQSGKKGDSVSKIIKRKSAKGMSQEVGHLPSNLEALRSNPNTPTKKSGTLDLQLCCQSRGCLQVTTKEDTPSGIVHPVYYKTLTNLQNYVMVKFVIPLT
jgi:hypothetical protein